MTDSLQSFMNSMMKIKGNTLLSDFDSHVVNVNHIHTYSLVGISPHELVCYVNRAML